MQRITTAVAILILLGAAAVAAAEAPQRWLHVQVHEQGPDGARVELNLPIEMVHEAVPLVERSTGNDLRVELGEGELSGRELKDLLREVARAPEGTFVEIEDGGDTVRVARHGDELRIQVREAGGDGASVNARVPMRIVAALASGPGEELNIAAAVEELAASEDGELVTITDAEGRTAVRLWVDSRNGQG